MVQDLEDIKRRLHLGSRAPTREMSLRTALGADVRENLGAADTTLDVQHVVAPTNLRILPRVLAVHAQRRLDLDLLPLVVDDTARHVVDEPFGFGS